MPLTCCTAYCEHCCCTRLYQTPERISFTIKHSFCSLAILISVRRPCLTVNQNILFTQLSRFSRMLRKSLLQVCFKSIQVIGKCSAGNISLSGRCCLTVFHRRLLQAEAMSGQCLGFINSKNISTFGNCTDISHKYLLIFAVK